MDRRGGRTEVRELEATTRLNDYLDGVIVPPDDATLRRHLDLCSACLARFDFERRLVDTLREKCRAGGAPQRLRERVAAVLAAEGAQG